MLSTRLFSRRVRPPLRWALSFPHWVERVDHGGAGEARGQVLVAGLQLGESGLDALHVLGAVLLALGVDLFWRSHRISQLGFDAVELLHLGEHPLCVGPFGFGIKELSPRAGHAADE